MSTRIALIPAYEPDQTLTKVVMELKKKKFEIKKLKKGAMSRGFLGNHRATLR